MTCITLPDPDTFAYCDDRSHRRKALFKIIQRIAYELSCDEIKLMVDKLETGDEELKRSLVRIYQLGRLESFYFWERLAIAPAVHRWRRQGAKVAIAETIFNGIQEGLREQQDVYIPGKTIYQDRT